MTRVAGTWIRSNRIVGHAGSAGFLAADTTIAMAHWNVSGRSDRPGIPDATTPQKKPVPVPQTAFWEITSPANIPVRHRNCRVGGEKPCASRVSDDTIGTYPRSGNARHLVLFDDSR